MSFWNRYWNAGWRIFDRVLVNLLTAPELSAPPSFWEASGYERRADNFSGSPQHSAEWLILREKATESRSRMQHRTRGRD
jgi:hypothetical protein